MFADAFGVFALLPRVVGAAGPTRTDDLTLTKRLLYQLSYSSISEGIFHRTAWTATASNVFPRERDYNAARREQVHACRGR